MKSCKIFIYKLQVSRFKLLNLISEYINFRDFTHNKYYSSGILETYTINVSENHIKLIFFTKNENNNEIAYDIKNLLIEKLNAESIYFELDDVKEWTYLKNYKPKLINRIRYKLLDYLKD